VLDPVATCATGSAGPELRRLFESAIAAARRVRAETALGHGVASIPRASVEYACRHRGTLSHSTVLLIDLAVPRDVDPDAAALAGVELLTIDDSGRVVQGVLARRRAELPAAYSILGGEVARLTRWLGAREAANPVAT
jgi:glutamyl-tRNA reductase